VIVLSVAVQHESSEGKKIDAENNDYEYDDHDDLFASDAEWRLRSGS
jgi:hypothetical protein